MWKVVSKQTGEEFYMLSEKGKYTVGRHNCDLDIKDDSSISRNHAYLLALEDSVDVIDVGSKFNTFCNENIENKIPLLKNQSYKLKDGQRVKFGQLHSEYIITKMKIVTVTSNLNTSDKQKLKEIMKVLNAQMQDNITPECTHLTMDGIIITVKLLDALIEGISIVTLKFWTDYLNALRKGKNTLPDTAKYLPDVTESFMNVEKDMFIMREERKTLFNGKIFMFGNKKLYDNFNHIIEKAGGQSKTLNHKIPLVNLAKKNVVVIQFTSSTQSQASTQQMDKISEFLKKKTLRLIPDYEIGLALVHCSTEKYCNPQFNIENEFFKENNTVQQTTETNKFDVIAEETPNLDVKNKKVSNHLPIVEIPESIVSAVYDLTDSQVMESDEINSEITTAAKKEQENLVNIVVQNEFQNEHDKMLQDLSDSIIDKQKNKRKRDSSPKENENQSTKKANLESEIVAENFSLDNIPNKPKPFSGFLDKSLIQKSKSQSNDQTNEIISHNPINQKKRRRFAKLESDDDEENENEDLFDFGDSSKNKRKRAIVVNSSDDDDKNSSDDESLFNIRKRTFQETNSTNSQSTSDTVTTVISKPISNYTKKSYTKEWNKTNTPQETISTSGWLSKQLIKVKIKDEVDTSNEDTKTTTDTPEIKIKTENDSKWFDSIKDVFEVRVKPMQLISKYSAKNVTDSNHGDNINFLNSTTNGKNFKAFVKKQNFKPQKEILKTVSHHITGFSF